MAGIYTNFVRKIVKENPQIKLKLKKAGHKLTPFQYVNQTINMTIMSVIALLFIAYPFFKDNTLLLILVEISAAIILAPILFKFWFSFVDVQIRKYARNLEGDLLFVSEYLLVTLESGIPLGNAIHRLSEMKRPGGVFFKRIYTDFKTGSNLETALDNGADYAPCDSVKILLKRLKDSLEIGIDLKQILENFIDEASQRKITEIKAFSKKLNPIVMMYLLLGIVIPSLGVTFLILGISIASPGNPELLKYILIFVFMTMFTFQYFSYTSFKFSKSTL